MIEPTSIRQSAEPIPSAPRGLQRRGRAFWRAVTREFLLTVGDWSCFTRPVACSTPAAGLKARSRPPV